MQDARSDWVTVEAEGGDLIVVSADRLTRLERLMEAQAEEWQKYLTRLEPLLKAAERMTGPGIWGRR